MSTSTIDSQANANSKHALGYHQFFLSLGMRLRLTILLSFFSSMTFGQCVCPDDDAPLFTSFYNDQNVSCGVDFYDYEPSFWDECIDSVTMTLNVDTSYIDSHRWLLNSNPLWDDNEIALTVIIPGFTPDAIQCSLDIGSIEYQSDQGTAVLQGHASHIEDLESGFDFYVELESRQNADEWLNQDWPTNYKDDIGWVEEEYMYWDYYLVSSSSYLVGTGRFLGTLISLSHAPPNLYYAWQEGVKANSRSEHNGCGGWTMAFGDIYVDGNYFPLPFDGLSANFYFDLADCLIPEYTLTWTATDMCGNSASHTHTLTTSTFYSWESGCPCGVFGCINEDAENYNPYATLSIGQCYGCSGDFNNDGDINMGDLVSFLSEFGCEGSCLFDINNDQVVNTTDLVVMLNVFGEGCD